METEILDETKALEKIQTQLRKVETAIFKKRFWNEADEQETLERQKIKTEAKKKVNKRKEKSHKQT